MKRAYQVRMAYQAYGNRFERVEEKTIEATSAGMAVFQMYKDVKQKHTKDRSRKVKEVLGGTFSFKVYVAERADTVATQEEVVEECQATIAQEF